MMEEVGIENYNFQKIVAIVGITLMIIKFLAFSITNSVSILTDAMESIVNVVAALIGLYALYLSALPPDNNHPYGHGKVEVVSANIEGTLIIIAGLLIIAESIAKLLNPVEMSSIDYGLILIGITALVNYAVGMRAIYKGKRNRSSALIASGKHLCTDTLTSVGIIAGLGVVYVADLLGYNAMWLDPCIALVFASIIIITGFKVLKDCMDIAMDKADPVLLKEVTACMNEYRHDDWVDMYGLRITKYGTNLHVDLHLVLPSTMVMNNVSLECKEIDEALKSLLGESMELSITPMSCQSRHCKNCKRNCLERAEEFEKEIEWTSNVICGCLRHDG